MILLKNIIKTYGKNENQVQALNGIDIEIKKGEMVAIMGVSGSGKSTLLNIIGCIDTPTSGKYCLNNKDVSKMFNSELAKIRNENLGFVVQHFALIEDYDVFKNVKVPLDYTKLSRKDKKQRIIKILKSLGIENKIDKFPNELSGGQCQRVAIARALVNNPDILLADEPTGALDHKTGTEIMNIFKNLNKDGKTIIIVTHDEKVAMLCNRTITIEDGRLL